MIYKTSSIRLLWVWANSRANVKSSATHWFVCLFACFQWCQLWSGGWREVVAAESREQSKSALTFACIYRIAANIGGILNLAVFRKSAKFNTSPIFPAITYVHCSQLKYASEEERDRAKIGRYAAENGAARATRHFAVPETTGRRLKSEWSHHLVTSSRSETRNPPNLKPTKCLSWQISQTSILLWLHWQVIKCIYQFKPLFWKSCIWACWLKVNMAIGSLNWEQSWALSCCPVQGTPSGTYGGGRGQCQSAQLPAGDMRKTDMLQLDYTRWYVCKTSTTFFISHSAVRTSSVGRKW